MDRVLLISCLVLCAVVVVDASRSVRTANTRPRGWELSPHEYEDHKDITLNLTIALTQRNTDILEELFWNISDPSHESYASHLEYEELVDLLAPTNETINEVIDWLRAHGVKREEILVHESRDFLSVPMRVASVDKLLQTRHRVITHRRSKATGLLMDHTYSVPSHVAPHIDFVSHFHLAELKVVRTSQAKRQTPRAISTTNTPALYRTLGHDGRVLSGVVFFCPDGSVPQNQTCGGKVILAQVANLLTTSDRQIVSTSNITACGSCSESASCSAVAEFYGWPEDVTKCAITFNVTNYIPYLIEAYLLFDDQTKSSVGTSIVIEGMQFADPQFTSQFYGISPNVVTSKQNKQAIAEFLGESVSRSDLKQYLSFYGLPDRAGKLKFFNPLNNDQSNPTFEANLDAQVMMGVARDCPTYVYAYPHGENFLKWIIDVLGQKSAPYVFSVSYADEEWATTPGKKINNYEQRLNKEFMKAGVRGISLLFASGDCGPFSYSDYSNTTLDPFFPSSSPYVTAVGGTQPSTLLYTNPACATSACAPTEVAGSSAIGGIITSGGGFSNLFARPSYQKAAVSAYLGIAKSLPPGGAYIRGRGYPDIAAFGHAFKIFVGGTEAIIGGTSGSTPLASAIITLLNDIRLNKGLKPLGFLNPLFYSLPASVFNDITSGDNKCNVYYCPDNTVGFDAGPGWDPVTGLGSINFPNMAAAISALPK